MRKPPQNHTYRTNANRSYGSAGRPGGNTTRSQGMPPRRRKPRVSKKRISLLILTGLLLVILIPVLIISLVNRQPAASLPPTSSVPAMSVITASVPAEPEPFWPQPVGDYIEDDIPLLLNNDNYIPQDFVPNLSDIGGGYQLDEKAAVAYIAMQAAAAADGINLFPVSGYRTNEHQTRNYNNSIQNYKNQGYSEEEATRLTEEYYARPGTSEHEAGLAVDVNSLYTTFEDTKEFTWLQEHCTDFGFILRYNRAAEELTGKAYEPWHYRYVGTNHAKAITELGITLDEYVPLLQGEWFVEEYPSSSGPASGSGSEGNTTGDGAVSAVEYDPNEMG